MNTVVEESITKMLSYWLQVFHIKMSHLSAACSISGSNTEMKRSIILLTVGHLWYFRMVTGSRLTCLSLTGLWLLGFYTDDITDHWSAYMNKCVRSEKVNYSAQLTDSLWQDFLRNTTSFSYCFWSVIHWCSSGEKLPVVVKSCQFFAKSSIKPSITSTQ